LGIELTSLRIEIYPVRSKKRNPEGMI
jgi:hypothetical protein